MIPTLRKLAAVVCGLLVMPVVTLASLVICLGVLAADLAGEFDKRWKGER